MEEDPEANLENFLEWATELGISDSSQSEKSVRPVSSLGQSLHLSYFPDAGGRGLAAVRDLRKGELILRVPKSALVTTESLLRDSQALSDAVQKHHFVSSTQMLAVALLNEVGKGKSSSWYPYLLQIPRNYDTLACFDLFETRALQFWLCLCSNECQVEDAIWDAEKAVGKAELEWKEAIGLMVEIKLKLHLRTFKAWLWASATISSRTMHVPWDAAGCLCPVGDFFNYAAPREEMLNSADAITLSILSSLQDGSSDTKQQLRVQQSGGSLLRLTDGVYEEDNGAYCFYARRNYRKGEQVLLSYGTYTNLELLEHYGFLLDENPNDKAFIPLEPEMYALCSWPWDSLYINQDGKPSFALLSTMRLWATPPNQRKSVRHHAYAGSQISSDNERIVMDWMAKKCHAVLKNFPTLVCEDELLLRTINEMGDLCTVLEMEKIPPVIRDEVSAFLGCNDLMKGKKRRAVHRWRLAVEWRLKYKKMLVDCVSRCIDAVDNAISS